MKVTWLGQSGFLFESKGERLLIDPFYSDIVEQKQGLKRLMQPPIPMADLQPDLIFITHNHIDHLDPIALPQIHQLYPTIPIIGPESVVRKALELGLAEDVLKHIASGKSFESANYKLIATPAYHSDPFSVGCIIESDGKTIYCSGDTQLTDTLFDEVASILTKPLDMVFIVINGKLGNMNVNEAVELTTQLRPGSAIPMHYGMFAENTEDPAVFVRGCAAGSIEAFELYPGIETEL